MAHEIRYARSGDVNIAYEVSGTGPLDLVLVSGWVSHLEVAREAPENVRLFDRLSDFARLIRFDKRGTGMSDRVDPKDLPTLEQRIDDVRAVLDAVGSRHVALLGMSEGGPMCALFAATYPERTSALIMYGSYARRTAAPGYPFGVSAADLERYMDRIETEWGTAFDIETRAPSAAKDSALRELWTRRIQRSASPAAAHALARMNAEVDIRAILPAIRVPTLILHKTGDRVLPVEGARFIASAIPGARFVELPGDDHAPVLADVDLIADLMQEFLTGARPVPHADRVLATVLFTDIVGSTEKAVALGDDRWRAALERHHAVVREQLGRFRGREIDNAGDGFFATFDGPARSVRCALEIAAAVRPLGLEIRAGVHTGECEILGPKVSGVGVVTGSRVAALAGPGEVLVTRTVRDLVAGSGLRFADRGEHHLKGIAEPWQLFAASV